MSSWTSSISRHTSIGDISRMAASTSALRRTGPAGSTPAARQHAAAKQAGSWSSGWQDTHPSIPSGVARLLRMAWARRVVLPKPAPATMVVTFRSKRASRSDTRRLRTTSAARADGGRDGKRIEELRTIASTGGTLSPGCPRPAAGYRFPRVLHASSMRPPHHLHTDPTVEMPWRRIWIAGANQTFVAVRRECSSPDFPNGLVGEGGPVGPRPPRLRVSVRRPGVPGVHGRAAPGASPGPIPLRSRFHSRR